MGSPERNSPADYSTDVQDSNPRPSIAALTAQVEALLFVAPGPVEPGRLATALEATRPQIDAALEELTQTYRGRGLTLESNRYGVQLTSAPGLAPQVERFLELETTSRLTKAALEVLSVVAYQQPVTRPYVDSIRGVNSDSALRTLMRHGLIEEVGRTDAPGRPILYATTPEFLQYFGLSTLDQLPPLNLEAELERSEGERNEDGSETES